MGRGAKGGGSEPLVPAGHWAGQVSGPPVSPTGCELGLADSLGSGTAGGTLLLPAVVRNQHLQRKKNSAACHPGWTPSSPLPKWVPSCQLL